MPRVTKLRLRFKRPRITAAATVTGAAGTVVRIPYTVAGTPPFDTFLSGPNAALFQDDGAYITLLDSSVAGAYPVTLEAVDNIGRPAIPLLLTFTVTGVITLPALVLTTSALDAHTIQCVFTNNVAYANYQFAANGDFSKPLNLAINKQIPVAQSGQDLNIQVRGIVSGGAQQGPWSNVSTVSLPFATLELIAVTIDADTVELQFSDDATYVRYQAQLKIGVGAYGAPIDLDGTKRVNGLIPGTTYTAQVRGSTT